MKDVLAKLQDQMHEALDKLPEDFFYSEEYKEQRHDIYSSFGRISMEALKNLKKVQIKKRIKNTEDEKLIHDLEKSLEKLK